jgi:hypothetical protein
MPSPSFLPQAPQRISSMVNMLPGKCGFYSLIPSSRALTTDVSEATVEIWPPWLHAPTLGCVWLARMLHRSMTICINSDNCLNTLSFCDPSQVFGVLKRLLISVQNLAGFLLPQFFQICRLDSSALENPCILIRTHVALYFADMAPKPMLYLQHQE